MDADMVELAETQQQGGVGVESLISEISRDPGVTEVHVREETHWTWTRFPPDDPEDSGIRYGRHTELSVVGPYSTGHETVVARLILNRDAITHVALDRGQPYALVSLVAKALGLR